MTQEDRIRQQELDQKRQFWKTHIASWQASQLKDNRGHALLCDLISAFTAERC